MSKQRYEAVVIGAGIAGIAAAHAIAKLKVGPIALVDDGPPLGLTSDKSTECYRNFWPGPDGAMLEFMNDSIAGLIHHATRSGDRFVMRQRGYLFATARPGEVDELTRQARAVEAFGAGPCREHRLGDAAYPTSPLSTDATLDGADLITDRAVIRKHFPYLSDATLGVLHVRKCGALSAQQLGMHLLEEARAHGAELIPETFIGTETAAGNLSAVTLQRASGPIRIETPLLVLAPGPHLKSAAALAGADLPVHVEKHVKISMADPLGIIPRDAPLTIWNDPIDLPWQPDERAALAESPETARLLETFPAGVHGRPVGVGDQVLMYWTYDCEISDTPVFPIEPDPYLPEITLRGMARMVPGLEAYLDPMPKPYADGGYYTKTADNRPLIGPLTVPGTYVSGAYSGYGIMAACAGGSLTAAHVAGRALPAYAPAFAPDRFDDPAYRRKVAGLAATGQL